MATKYLLKDLTQENKSIVNIVGFLSRNNSEKVCLYKNEALYRINMLDIYLPSIDCKMIPFNFSLVESFSDRDYVYFRLENLKDVKNYIKTHLYIYDTLNERYNKITHFECNRPEFLVNNLLKIELLRHIINIYF